jgi:hypothetical protein
VFSDTHKARHLVETIDMKSALDSVPKSRLGRAAPLKSSSDDNSIRLAAFMGLQIRKNMEEILALRLAADSRPLTARESRWLVAYTSLVEEDNAVLESYCDRIMQKRAGQCTCGVAGEAKNLKDISRF